MPEELPVSGDPYNETTLELIFPGRQPRFKLNGKKLQLLDPLDRDDENLSHVVFQVRQILTRLAYFRQNGFRNGTLGRLLLLRLARSCEIKFVESVICVLRYVIGSCPLRASQCLSRESHVYFSAIRSEHVTGRVSEPG